MSLILVHLYSTAEASYKDSFQDHLQYFKSKVSNKYDNNIALLAIDWYKVCCVKVYKIEKGMIQAYIPEQCFHYRKAWKKRQLDFAKWNIH